MTRQTSYQGLDVPESGDSDYHETINRFVDAIDERVLLRSPRGARPSAEGRGRWHLATDRDPPTLSFELEDRWVGIGGDYQLPDAVTYADIQETITEPWTFENGLEGTLDGQATSALEAEHAQTATNAHQLGGNDPDTFTRADQQETIDRRWTFTRPQVFEGRVDVVDGVINLPQHESSDPPSDQRQPGSMWFRLDDQPTN